MLELGLDYGCRLYCGGGRETKTILILEEQPHRHGASISDLAGCDVQAHGARYDEAIRRVRSWIASEARLKDAPGPLHIIARYDDVRAWHYERLAARGFAPRDIEEYTMQELLTSMREWIDRRGPLPT
ncbi:hypothetical protein ACTZWW_13180 [Salinarimonas sp. NSM]|uniref:hypothetical protein n=1 Tax=Salinarimonas sp. NSM TaxID=3458003 RepID=UPI0040368EB2